MASEKLTGMLDRLRRDVDGDSISLGDVVAHFESRGFGPLLLIPAIVATLPTGAVPGVPAVCGVFIALISIQIVFGKSHPWLPKWLRDRSIDHAKFDRAFDKAKPWTRRIDRLLQPRLEVFTRETGTRVAAVVAVLLGGLMVPLEAIPMAVAIPGCSIVAFGLGLSAKDGLLTLIGLVIALAALVVSWQVIPF